MRTSELDEYKRRLAILHTDRNRTTWKDQPNSRAPHKPVLLLCVLDLFAEGSVSGNLIEITDDLLDMFSVYMARVLG
ncbi:MAG: hypothetical protein LC772_13120, partial [Chloroflexi bacterium]|nr:hypothetical protein [Chloroflexota bacterium]